MFATLFYEYTHKLIHNTIGIIIYRPGANKAKNLALN